MNDTNKSSGKKRSSDGTDNKHSELNKEESDENDAMIKEMNK